MSQGLGEPITVKEAVRKMKRNRTPPRLMTKLRWMESDHQQVIALACWGTVQRSLLSTRLDHLNIKGESYALHRTTRLIDRMYVASDPEEHTLTGLLGSHRSKSKRMDLNHRPSVYKTDAPTY